MHPLYRFPVLCMFVLCLSTFSLTQTETATVSGRVTDQQGGLVQGAEVVMTNVDTNLSSRQATNGNGLYVLSGVKAGRYRISVTKGGFQTINLTNLVLNVQDSISQNFKLQVGSVSESVTVVANEAMVNTESAAVSTVVDRQFAENLPMNGRSFQSLIELTPGVALTVSNNADNGQFSVNGQRAASNYWMVDGVGANVGVSATNQPGNGLSGAMPSLSVLGGTNSLVSVDAMQEFRIQTSTYSPEFGRTPGGQISIVTRSGTNQWHGSTFDYFRNDILDANDWFNGAAGLKKPADRQNDFGGTFSGPVLKNKTFFFFSYEGLRLRLPRTGFAIVPDLNARRSAGSATQPFLKLFPVPNGAEVLSSQGNPTGTAHFDGSYSDRASLDAYSLKVDHKLGSKVNLFGRYSYSPSTLTQRGVDNSTLSTILPANITSQTGTVGFTWVISSSAVDDVRFNYSRTSGSSYAYLDSFGGATPLSSFPLPSSFTTTNAAFQLYVFGLHPLGINVGPQGNNLQRQINIVDNLSLQKNSHSLKFGIDYRRLSPFYGNPEYDQEALFLNVPAVEAGNVFLTFISATRAATLFFHNLGVFGQDTWRVTPRFTVTYGLRWDVDFAPSANPALAAVTGFNLRDLSSLALALPGTPSFSTTYGNIAPRIGLAYHLVQNQKWPMVLRGGVGLFYDLASSEAGNLAYYYYYPFGALKTVAGGNFPLSPSEAAPPAIGASSTVTGGVFAFDPNLKLPYTVQWSMAVEQSLGKQQTVTASYIGSVGRRLIETALIQNSPSPNFNSAYLVTNAARSDYHALQLQFKRRLSHGLQALASYTWAHSIDDGSAGSIYGNTSNALLPGVTNPNRGPSDFDIRNGVTAGVTFDIPTPDFSTFANAIFHAWSIESFITAHSASPVTVYDGSFFGLQNDYAQIRPDVVPGQPLYLSGSQCTSVFQAAGTLPPGASCPGGKGFNPAAFTPPPTDSNGNPLRQGDLGRNALRGFRAAQWDLAVHREFPIRESLKVQFRAEMFNFLNHPNFAPPVPDTSNQGQFGLSTKMLGQYLGGGNVGRGGYSPLYQTGGPRSIQLALKLQF